MQGAGQVAGNFKIRCENITEQKKPVGFLSLLSEILTCTLQPATCNLQPATCNLQFTPSGSNSRHFYCLTFMLVVEDSSSIADQTGVLASQPDHERTLERWEDDKSGRETLIGKGMERDRSGVAFHSPPRNFETSVRKFWLNGLRPGFPRALLSLRHAQKRRALGSRLRDYYNSRNNNTISVGRRLHKADLIKLFKAIGSHQK